MAESRIFWEASRSAVIICDMWDLRGLRHCRSATMRIEELAPAMNRVLAALRQEGAFIVHAPSGCMNVYRDTEARLRAANAVQHTAPVKFD